MPLFFLQAVKYPSKREVREFNGKQYLMEEAIKGDVAFIRAWKVDEAGNVVFRYAAHNFSAAMARSARMTIVEVSPPTICVMVENFTQEVCKRTEADSWMLVLCYHYIATIGGRDRTHRLARPDGDPPSRDLREQDRESDHAERD